MSWYTIVLKILLYVFFGLSICLGLINLLSETPVTTIDKSRFDYFSQIVVSVVTILFLAGVLR
jgi:hypothetical protein